MKSHTRGKLILAAALLFALIVFAVFGTGAYIIFHFLYKAVVHYW